MPLYIKGDPNARLVSQLAKTRGMSKQDAVKSVAQAKLARLAEAIPLRHRFDALRAAHPLPPPKGELADQDFFDQLSGEL